MFERGSGTFKDLGSHFMHRLPERDRQPGYASWLTVS